MDVGLQLAKNDADKALKEVTSWASSAASELNKTLGGALSKVFDGFDSSKARDEYAKLARAAADSERAQVSSAGNVEVAIKRLHDAHDKYGASAAQTAAAENRVVDAWARSGQAAMDAAAAADVASQAHERVAAGAVGLNSSMLLAAGGIAAVGVAAVEVGKKLFDMGEQWADISDKFTFTTGKIGADAAAMTDQVAKIADGTAAPIAAIGGVYTQLTRLKELSGQTLNDLTKQVADYDQMAQKAGADPLNIGVFTRVMQEFHVPAGQVAADLNTIVGAAQAGQVPINELVQTLQTAAPTADILGLSFGQLTNVIAVLDESGVDVDKTLKGLQLGVTQLAKDTPALQKLIKFTPDENELQRLKDVIDKIHELQQAGDGIDADKLGTAAFGRGWQAIVDQIEQGKLKVDDLNTSAAATPHKIEDMRTATERFGDDWQKVKNQIEDALKPLSEDVFQTLDKGLQAFERRLGGDNLGDLFKFFTTGERSWKVPGPDHASNDPDAFKNLGPSANNPVAAAGTPTAPNINTAKPYYAIDENPADKPPGAETMDEWINSQKAVRSAMDHQADTSERAAEAQQKLTALQDSGKATQDQLNQAFDELNTAVRDNKQATDDVTDANRKYTEDANKTKKGKAGEVYDPFTEATKNSHGLIPELAGLFTAAAVNQALGNPFGKLEAAKRGEDPSNPLYVSDVGGANGPDGSAGGPGNIPGILGRLFSRDAVAQAQGAPDANAAGLPPSNAPAGSIPQIVAQGAGAPGGAPSAGSPSAGVLPTAGAPSDIPMPPPGSGAEGWRNTVAAVVDKYGPAVGVTSANRQAWIDDITKQIGTESSGNPNADNPNDTNGRGGTQHVAGLLQYLPSSYAGSGGKLTGLPYMDPVGQIAGALFAPRNPDGSPNTGAPGGIGAGHGWGPTDTPITGVPNAAVNIPPPAPPGPAAPAAPPPDANSISARGPDGTVVRVPRGTLEHGGYPGYQYIDRGTPPPARPPGPSAIPGLFPPAPSGPGFPLFGYASGGSIAASDTQPAMLTPGEFVVKKDVAQKHLAELRSMNAGQEDQHKPTPDRMSPSAGGGPVPSSRQPLGSVTPPPPGPRVGQGTGSGFGIGGGLIGMAESAAMMAAMGAAGAAEGGLIGMAAGDLVPTTPGGIGTVGAGSNIGATAPSATPAPGGGGQKSGAPSGGGGDPMTAVLNRTVGYIGQLGAIGVGGLMSSLIPGASQKGGIMDGGILSKVIGGFAGAHPSAPNSAGTTPTPLAPPKQGQGYATGGEVSDDGDTNHIAQQTNGVHIQNMTVQNGQTGTDVANDLAFRSYAGYNGR